MIGHWRRRAGEKLQAGSRGGAGLAPAGPDPARRGPTATRPERLAVDYAGDPEAAQAAIERLLDEYGVYVEEGHKICVECPVTRSGGFVVRSMLEWKAIHGDGRLDRWTRSDVREYGDLMLNQLARETPADGRLLDCLLDSPTCVRDLAYFLSDRGTPAAHSADALAEAAEEILGELAVSGRDPQSLGLAEATRVLGAMVAGSDERGGAPAAGGAPQPAPSKSTRARQAKRRKRRAVRAARKRNRR